MGDKNDEKGYGDSRDRECSGVELLESGAGAVLSKLLVAEGRMYS